MEKKVTVSTEELKEIKDNMAHILDSFTQECTECVKKLDETKEIFYTPTAEYFREKAGEYIYQQINFIDNSVKRLVDQLQMILTAYEDLHGTIGQEVGRG